MHAFIFIVQLGVTGNALPDITRFIAHGANEVLTEPLTKFKPLDAIAG
jgi:hypothetical protein